MRRPSSSGSASRAGPAAAALLLLLVPGLVSFSQKSEDTCVEAPFTGTVTITRSLGGSRTLEGGGSIARSENGSVRAVIRGCNPEKDGEGRTIGCRPYGTVNATAEGRYVMSGENTTLTVTTSGSGVENHSGAPDDGSGMPTLEVNPVRGLYRLGLPAGSVSGTKVQLVTLVDPKYEEKESSEWSASLGLDVDDEVEKEIRDRSYSPKSGTITGSFSVVRIAAGSGELPSTGDADGAPMPGLPIQDLPFAFDATYTVTWSLSLGSGPAVRAEIEPAGEYDQWIPVSDEDKNQIAVKLRLVEPPVSFIVVHELGHRVGIDHHDPEESGAATCPMRIPGTDPRAYSLFAIAAGRMGWGERYCTRCIARLSVSDRRRSR